MENIQNILVMSDKNLLNLLEKTTKGSRKKDSFVYWENKQSPLLLQAHVDTVRKTNHIKLSNKRGIIWAKGTHLGADDRAGVFSILKIREENKPCPNLLFTNGEEMGGWGMWDFLCAKYNLDHIRLALAFDRQGCGEFVTYNHLPLPVKEYVTSFGFTQTHGSFSDIECFTEYTQIPSVNLSVGYYFAHSIKEKLHTDEMFLTINRVKRMIAEPIKKLYKSRRQEIVFLPWQKSTSFDYGKARVESLLWEEQFDDYYGKHESRVCEICGEDISSDFPEEESISLCEKCSIYFQN